MFSLGVFITLISIHAAAVISPGQDTILVIKNSLKKDNNGILTAIGITLANAFYIIVSAVGFGALSATYPILFMVVRALGASFLFYVGIQEFKSGFSKGLKSNDSLRLQFAVSSDSGVTALREGFLSTITNAKAAIYFISFTSQFINSENFMYVNVIYVASMLLVTLLWFSGLGWLFKNTILNQILAKRQGAFEVVVGVMLTLLGLVVLFELFLELFT